MNKKKWQLQLYFLRVVKLKKSKQINNDELRQCIYCKEVKVPDEFNSEHVVSESLGGPDHFQLECVCQECNTFFGDNLELYFGRDSIYGILYRGLAGVLKPKNFAKSINFRRKRVEPTIFHHDLGKLIVDLFLNSKHGYDFSLANQIIFRNSTNGVSVPYRLNNVPHKNHIEGLGLKTTKEHIILIANPLILDEELNSSSSAITRSELQLRFDDKRKTSTVSLNKEEEIHFSSFLDETILRTICKLAFNCFAKRMGAHFVLSESFDEIRNFIRYGSLAAKHLVSWPHLIKPRYHDGANFIYAKHKFIFKKKMQSNQIIAYVSLFNDIEFEVILTRNYPLHIEINEGIIIDTKAKKAEEIQLGFL